MWRGRKERNRSGHHILWVPCKMKASQVAQWKRICLPMQDTRDVGLIPGSGRFPGEGSGNPFQYPCLENPMDRGAWWATVHEAAKSRTWLSDCTELTETIYRCRWRLDYIATATEENVIMYLIEDKVITNLSNWTQKNYSNSPGTMIK